MSLQTVASKFVELCNQNKNFDVMRTLYAPDIVSVENSGEETRGQQPVIQKSERWAADNTMMRQVVHGPFFSGEEQFAVHFIHEVTPKATSKRKTLEEVAVYTVGGDRITREQFFYEGSR